MMAPEAHQAVILNGFEAANHVDNPLLLRTSCGNRFRFPFSNKLFDDLKFLHPTGVTPLGRSATEIGGMEFSACQFALDTLPR